MWTPKIVSYTRTNPNQAAMAVDYTSDDGRVVSFTHNIGDDFSDDQENNQNRVLEIMNLKCAELQGIDEQTATRKAQADDIDAFLADPLPVAQPIDLSVLTPTPLVSKPTQEELAAQAAAEAAAQAAVDYYAAERVIKGWQAKIALGIVDTTNPDYQAALKDAQGKFKPEYVSPMP